MFSIWNFGILKLVIFVEFYYYEAFVCFILYEKANSYRNSRKERKCIKITSPFNLFPFVIKMLETD